MWVYTMIWSWKFAVGFVLLIFVHELGHVAAARRFGIKVTAPMFIPFMGAFIALQSAMKNAYVEAEIGIAGPIWGSLAAAACHFIGLHYDMPLFLALAWMGYWLNLFNLIPAGQMDGGHVVQALWPWMQMVGFAILLYIAVMRPGFLIIMLLVLSLPRIIALFRGRTEEEREYYDITAAQRWKMGLLYFGLIALLTLGMYELDERLASIRAGM
jgi:Zn-dependent protease